jgi:SagB-type dehydrogenase family enzyme
MTVSMDAKITYTNSETGRMFAYHDKTKHSYWSVRNSGHFLDWANQPSPFRYYEGADIVSLPERLLLPEISTFTTLDRLGQFRASSSAPEINPDLISQLLYFSMAISAWKQVRGTEFRYSLRVNPSSGNLHPTETYVAVQNASGLADGLYHYRVLEHWLEQRRAGPAIQATAASVSLPGLTSASLVILLTSIFWRESWKYKDRAYRYCLLDLGHAAASILIAAQALGLNGLCVGHFPDLLLAELLGISALDEGPLMVIALGTDHNLNGTAPLATTSMGPLQGHPNLLSGEEVPYHLLQGMHQSTMLPPECGGCPAITRQDPQVLGDISLPVKPPRNLSLRDTVRKRRSGLDFDPKSSMTLDDLGALLAHTRMGIQSDYRGNLDQQSAHRLIDLYLYVHRVQGLSPGVYRYRPQTHQLQLIKEGDQIERAAYLSLEQALAAHACVAFSMIADLGNAGRLFGNRGYRYAHFEAGIIGQALYLGAEALGFNATGIGAFYDDEVHKYLGISKEQGQVIYHFAVGKAVPDARLINRQGAGSV